MKIIAGLGNPGEKYKTTRHNVGFLALDFILNDSDSFMEARPSHEFKSDIFSWESSKGEKIVFVKPQTYMNDSGQAIKAICDFYKVDLLKDILIIHDEVDLFFGTLRPTQSSSAAGHNGIKSIISELGTQNFSRLRVGVESRASRNDMPTENFVLQNFSDEEMEKLNKEVFPEIKKIVEKFIQS